MVGLPELPMPTWFVGCGNMGAAILKGWRAATIDLKAVTIIRPSGASVEGARAVTGFAQAGPAPKLVVLAFKPQQLDEIAPEMRQWLTSKTVIVSLLAGVEAKTLRERFPGAGKIVRVMPNLPVQVRRGVVALYSEDADEGTQDLVGTLFAALGFSLWASDEQRFGAIGAVAAAGPAYVARFVQALAKAAGERGISPEMSAIIALETVLGTTWMAATTNEEMASIAKRVASPKGTTQAGLDVLDRDHVLDELVGVAIAAAAQRSAELAEEARAASLEEPARLS
ncbi:MAG: pyrroline-5-carboxylate reductase dimerization domain-containing protein [Pseudomonadota bacterium]